jgi:DHA1 family tetracycline resistance protein-like MFS transporter
MDRYGWNERLIGASLAAYGLVGAVVQATAVGPILARLGERRAALLALGIDALALAAFGFATRGWMIFVLIVLCSPSGVAFPALRAVMSRAVSPSAQGLLQGAVGSLEGLAAIVGPVVMTFLFSAFGGASSSLRVPGAPFFVASALTVAAVVLFARAKA